MSVLVLLEQLCNKSDNVNKFVPYLLTTWDKQCEHNLIVDGLLADLLIRCEISRWGISFVLFYQFYWDFLQHIGVFSNCQFPKPIVLQLCDAFGNPCLESNIKVALNKDSGLKVGFDMYMLPYFMPKDLFPLRKIFRGKKIL
jgi:hypothetical protein